MINHIRNANCLHFCAIPAFVVFLICASNPIKNASAEAETNSHKQNTINSESEITSLKREITDIQAQIEKIIAKASCSTTEQCKALAIGQKACGGPLGYLPFSTQNTDTAQLLALSEQHQKRSKALNKLTGALSNCMMLTPPEFICREGRCQK